MGTRIVFEETWGRDRFRSYYPEHAGNFLTWEEWLEGIEPTPGNYSETRTTFSQALAATPSQAGDWLRTVEQLREAPLLTSEDVEYCFSFLPATQKNAFLRQLLDLYLGSPLAEGDRTARTLRAAQADENLQFPEGVWFLKARQPSPVFAELFKAVQRTNPDAPCRLAETWEWETSPPTSTRFARTGLRGAQAVPVIDRFCEKARHALQRFPADRVRLYFDGTDASRAYVAARLAGLGVRVDSSAQAAPTPTPLSFRASFFERLRQAPLLLSERLKLSEAWLHSTRASTPESFLEKWMEDQSLAPDRRELLRGLPARRTPPSTGDSTPLLAFHPLPAQAGTLSLVFLEPLPEPPGNLALDGNERFRLRAAGFAIPESEPHRDRNRQRLEALHAGAGRAMLFFAGEEVPPGWNLKESAAAPVAAAPLPAETAYVESETVPPLSATALEAYADCPAKYFYSHAARLRARKAPDDLFSLWFGKLVHSTLEKAFKENEWRNVDEKLLVSLFNELLKENQTGLGTSAWLTAGLRRRFRAVATQVGAMERQLRETLGDLEPTRFEEDFELRVGECTLRGRIDRIDRTSDGAALILDYKTGSVDFSPEQIKRGKHFQALVYALAAEARTEPAAGVLFYDLKKAEVRRGLVRQTQVSPTAKKAMTRGHAVDDAAWSEILTQGKEHLQGLGQALKSGDYRPTPSAAACEYCEFGVHCRSRFGWTGGAG